VDESWYAGVHGGRNELFPGKELSSRVEGSPDPNSRTLERVPIKTAYMTLFRDNSFWLIGLSYLLIAFALVIPFAFLPIFATEFLMVPYRSATGLIAIIAIAGAFGKLLLSHLSDTIDGFV